MTRALSPTREAERRLQRRIAVGLPMLVRGVDGPGTRFEDAAQTFDVSRTGASFVTRREIRMGMDLEIVIPQLHSPRHTGDFTTLAHVVRVVPGSKPGESVVGLQFIGPRFHRVFITEATI